MQRVVRIVTHLLAALIGAAVTYALVTKSVVCQSVVTAGSLSGYRGTPIAGVQTPVWHFDWSWLTNLIHWLLSLPGLALAFLISLPGRLLHLIVSLLHLPHFVWPWERTYHFPLGLINVHIPQWLSLLAALIALVMLVILLGAEWHDKWRNNFWGRWIRSLPRHRPFSWLPLWIKWCFWKMDDIIVPEPEPEPEAFETGWTPSSTFASREQHNEPPSRSLSSVASQMPSSNPSTSSYVPAPSDSGSSRNSYGGGSSHQHVYGHTHVCKYCDTRW